MPIIEGGLSLVKLLEYYLEVLVEDYQIVHNKIVDYSEIVICLFDNCNFNCAFCPQEHDSVFGMSRFEILDKVSPIVHWINSTSTSQFIKLHIMGGELFQDKLIKNNYLKIYEEFINSILNKVDPDKDLCFNFITNLGFENIEPVKEFLLKNQLKFSISYDPVARFSSKHKEIFEKNIESFKDLITMVSLTLTKQNINKILQGDPLFDRLYESFLCDFDQYLPATQQAMAYIPLDSEKLKFYKYLLDNYPNCINLDHFTDEKPEQKMRCTRGNSFTILPDGSSPKHCSGSIFLHGGDQGVLETNQVVVDYLSKENCLTCEFYQRCPLTCFVSDSYKANKNDIGTCVYKEVFKYVQA